VDIKFKAIRLVIVTPRQDETAGEFGLREAIGRQEGGHFEDAVIIIGAGELRCRGIVDDESHVGWSCKAEAETAE